MMNSCWKLVTRLFRPHAIILIVAGTLALSCGDRKDPVDRPSGSGNTRLDSILTSQQGNGTPRPVPKKPVDEMTKAERFDYIAELEKAGYFVCCIEPNCNMCLFDKEESCTCHENVKSDDPVCGECYKGWNKGKGNVPGIAVVDVKRR